MYYKHFGLDGPPFRFAPSASVLYLGKAHRECLAALEWGLMHDQCGFMLLMGETGTGKSTLLNAVLAQRPPCLQLACVTNPRLSFQEIMRVILPQLGVTTDHRGKLESIQALERVLASRPGYRVAIAVDEAQDLSEETLEDLRLLANCVGSQDQQLRIILIGHPELLDRLSAENLRQIRERISTKVFLDPLTAVESVDYIKCRLESQNGSTRVFEAMALRHLVEAAAGIPRRLNVLCHNALLLAYAKDADSVTLEVAREVVKDYESIFRPLRQPAHSASGAIGSIRPSGRLLRAATAAAALFVVALASLLMGTPHDWENALNRAAPLVATSVAHASRGISYGPSVEVKNPEAIESDAASTLRTSVLPPASLAAAPAITPGRMKVQIHAGDTFHDLAAKYLGSTDRTGDLIRANPQISDPNVLYVGETVYLPSTQ